MRKMREEYKKICEEIDRKIDQGVAVVRAIKEAQVSEATYYRWVRDFKTGPKREDLRNKWRQDRKGAHGPAGVTNSSVGSLENRNDLRGGDPDGPDAA